VLLVNPLNHKWPAVMSELGFTVAAQAADGDQADALCRFVPAEVALVDCRGLGQTDSGQWEDALPSAGLPLVMLWPEGVAPPPAEQLFQHGVYACLNADPEPQALAGALEAAHRAFSERQHMGRQTREMSDALNQRKLVSRACGLLMDLEGLSEQAALERLEQSARERNLSLAQVAEAIIERLGVKRQPRRRLVRPGGKGSPPK
jgi:response regulator NasT